MNKESVLKLSPINRKVNSDLKIKSKFDDQTFEFFKLNLQSNAKIQKIIKPTFAKHDGLVV